MSESEINLTPTRPYLARAIYDWICDNQLTPHLLVECHTAEYACSRTICAGWSDCTKYRSTCSTCQLHMSNDAITFSARFGGVSRDLYVPMNAVLGIYARENGQGLFFDPSEYAHIQNDQDTLESKTEEKTEQTKKKPSLRLLD